MDKGILHSAYAEGDCILRVESHFAPEGPTVKERLRQYQRERQEERFPAGFRFDANPDDGGMAR